MGGTRNLDVQHNTTFDLEQKLCEALAAKTASEAPDGEVQIDGAYFGGHVRQRNRKDRREKANQPARRRIVVALRQRGGSTLSFVLRSEAEGVQIAALVRSPTPSCSPMKLRTGMR